MPFWSENTSTGLQSGVMWIIPICAKYIHKIPNILIGPNLRGWLCRVVCIPFPLHFLLKPGFPCLFICKRNLSLAVWHQPPTLAAVLTHPFSDHCLVTLSITKKNNNHSHTEQTPVSNLRVFITPWIQLLSHQPLIARHKKKTPNPLFTVILFFFDHLQSNPFDVCRETLWCFWCSAGGGYMFGTVWCLAGSVCSVMDGFSVMYSLHPFHLSF